MSTSTRFLKFIECLMASCGRRAWSGRRGQALIQGAQSIVNHLALIGSTALILGWGPALLSLWTVISEL